MEEDHHHLLSIYDYIILWHFLCPGFVEGTLMVCQRVKDHDMNIICCSNCMFSKEESLKFPIFCLSFSFCGYHFSYIRYYGVFWTLIKDSPTHFFEKTFQNVS